VASVPGKTSDSAWVRVVLAGAAVFVLAAIAVGIVLVAGDDSESPAPSTTVADSVFPTVSPDAGGDKKQATDKPSKDPDGGGGASKPVSDGGNGSGGSSNSSGLSPAQQAAKEADCPYGREQCKQLWKAWKNRESHVVKTGPNAKCPYDREQCKQLKQAWKNGESIPVETGGNPKNVDCPYGREQCKALWESWQAATE
jgi:hypothetical protein